MSLVSLIALLTIDSLLPSHRRKSLLKRNDFFAFPKHSPSAINLSVQFLLHRCLEMDLSNNEEAFGIKRQTIVFVRHGVARHNVLDDKGNPPNLNDPDLFDPPLLLEGKRQALDAGQRLRIWWHTTQVGEHLELVITSPLTRCLQTTALAFLPGDQYAKDTPEPTIACMDLVREAYGMSYPDRRRPKELLMVRRRHIAYDRHRFQT